MRGIGKRIVEKRIDQSFFEFMAKDTTERAAYLMPISSYALVALRGSYLLSLLVFSISILVSQ
jgi:hypothetical protein